MYSIIDNNYEKNILRCVILCLFLNKMRIMNISQSTIYSIGHGNKSIKDFIEELKSFNIEYLIDVRSKPYSKWNPDFNQETLSSILKNSNIIYVYLGNLLGGLPQDRKCYNEEGKILYDIVKDQPYFQEGLQRLITANEKKLKIAVMCSETNPSECHRSKLIGQQLLTHNISMNHIICIGKSKIQEQVIAELTKGEGTIDLFGNTTDFTSRKPH